MTLKRFKVTVMDDSRAQDREDSIFEITIKATNPYEAEKLALVNEPVNCYVTKVEEL